MRIFRRWALIAITCTACSPGGSGPTSSTATSGGAGTTGGADLGDAAPATAADTYALIARAACERIFRCPDPDDDDLALRNVLGDEMRCNQFVPSLLASQQLGQQFYEAGRLQLRFDGAAASACAAAIRTCGAPFQFSSIAACRSMFQGTAQAGEPCHLDQDCAGDAYCANTPDAAATPSGCAGTCRPRLAAGAPCAVREQCTATRGFAECDNGADGGPSCVDFALAAGAPLGAACGLLEPSTLTPCVEGLWCDSSYLRPGVCRAPISPGETCTRANDVCTIGYACEAGADADAARSCVSIDLRTEGQPCQEKNTGVCDLFSSLVCTGGTCVRLGDGSEGAACRSGDFGDVSCQPGLICTQSDTCARPGKTGDPCQADHDCESGACGLDMHCAELICRTH